MNPPRRLIILVLLALTASIPLRAQDVAAAQTWTATDGRVVQARFIKLDGESVIVEKDGQQFAIPFAMMNAGSVALAKKLGGELGSINTTPSKTGSAVPNGEKTLPAPSKNAEFVNTLGMKFVPVPETKVFFCIHETRQQDYAVYATEVPNVDDPWVREDGDGKETRPAGRVTWGDAKAFCEWLSKKEGKTYRLPTDREWSFAVGIGPLEKWTPDATPQMLNGKVENEFPWGGEFPPKTEDFAGNYDETNLGGGYTDEFPPTDSKGLPVAAPVMSFKPNKFGLYDMGGNVYEWCEDWFDSGKTKKVLRGACYMLPSSDEAQNRDYLLSSHREFGEPETRYRHIGFRVVLETP